MKRALMWLAFAATLALPAFPALAQSVRLGFINMVRIERESKRPHQDAERLKQEFAAREAEIRDLHGRVTALQKQLETLSPDAAADEINAKRRELGRLAQHFEQTRRTFVEDVERRKAEERQKFLGDLRTIVARIAKAQKLDLVVQEAVYASRALDITDAVLKALDRAESGKP
ncbi:MAG TPA: OmpH family outer membrane protein [Burkholderiales bacterium]|jgi:outer membrane protein|nr:OmpH family outer membrane protein [Burkholderiales bacterium]